MSIEVIDHTPNPLTMMGLCASTCWGSKPKDLIKTADNCLESDHGRVAEFADVTLVISNYSAKMMRDLYTHIIGTSRLQASTRYINYENMSYVTPESIQNNSYAQMVYHLVMKDIQKAYKILREQGIPAEDASNLLPLGYQSKMVLKINCRALQHMAEIRTCQRAYHEFRAFMKELIVELKKLDAEWNSFVTNYMKTKCDKTGACLEKHPCPKGRLLQEDRHDRQIVSADSKTDSTSILGR